jgi:hypothetical protein
MWIGEVLWLTAALSLAISEKKEYWFEGVTLDADKGSNFNID